MSALFDKLKNEALSLKHKGYEYIKVQQKLIQQEDVYAGMSVPKLERMKRPGHKRPWSKNS